METGDAVIHFYCDPSEAQTLSAIYLFESLAKQLLDYLEEVRRDYPPEAVKRIERFYSPTGSEPDLEDITLIISVLFEAVPRCWLIIDGVDEMRPEEVSRVLQHLRILFDQATNQKMCLATRNEVGFGMKVSLNYRVRIDQRQTDFDMRRYIDSRITRKTEHSRTLTESKEIMSQVKKRLVNGANGM